MEYESITDTLANCKAWEESMKQYGWRLCKKIYWATGAVTFKMERKIEENIMIYSVTKR